MQVLAGECINGNCPAVYLDEGRVMVQGRQLTRTDLSLGPDEALVEIPAEQLMEAARCLTSQNS
jgi:hypothetical protein